ncbi:MAG: 50S ribosomal protein L13 [Candidatus Pacebacteria bacterium]|jgi:large subunit ribosomal protein L13|nr:50S ribosomal protein L13 [Candidatus Paceibacterota bacterium]MDD3072119.1 50S ribosomal protein L13 [Candidatus Paceibacterota bacterium]MDD3728816.1 50S ribosomal protein L13 [Candidatus Paceibacterota bacterium]MDD4201325.1 50S ribosomal protein L13 [Candidatus Paceibacterota bacterium]MDD4466997.1 50S ribosomal protein L13 [Candidatus Paceibacterota bacterium]
MERETHTIDAKDRPLGRLATEIAVLLRGKEKESFAPNKDIGGFVVVKNIKRIVFTGKKFDKKIYYRHTGYMGGLKETPLKNLFENNPGEVLRKAVYGMLPVNKLRAKQIKRLKIEDNG